MWRRIILKRKRRWKSYKYTAVRGRTGTSVRFALESGYSKIILCDTDIIANESLFTHENILKLFHSSPYIP